MTLAVRTPNWIGDCIMSLPALRALKNSYPRQILLVTRPHLAEIFSPPLIPPEDSFPVLVLPRGGWNSQRRAIGALREVSAGRGLLFTNSFASALVFRLAGISHLTGYRRDGRGILLKRGLQWPGKDAHQVDDYLDLAAAELGEDLSHGAVPELRLSPQAVEKARARLEDMGAEAGAPWFGISPCTAYGPAKEWPLELHSELIRRLLSRHPRATVLLFGGPAEESRLSQLSRTQSGRVINLARTHSLAESIATVPWTSVFISNDSGMMHVATALKVPQVALFGPTSPERVRPRAGSTRVIHHAVACGPCNRRQCGHHSCMRAITVREVEDEVEQALTGDSVTGEG